MQPGTETPFWDTSKRERGSLVFCVSMQSMPCVVSSSKYSIASDKYSGWDGHNQGKEKKEGCFERAACISGMLVILLWEVLCVMSTAVRRVGGEKEGGSGGRTRCLGPA
jgi:hypothetical protein